MMKVTKIALVSSLFSAVAGVQVKPKRGLAAGDHAAIAGFAPLTDVRDQNRIDRDQELINELVEAADFDGAKSVYENGAFSKVVATLTLNEALPADLIQGAQLHGFRSAASTSQRSEGPSDVIVTAFQNYTAGTTEIMVKYFTEDCYVGANPTPIFDGCLASEGFLAIPTMDALTLNYTYDPASTSNKYNIKLFTQPTEYIFAEGAAFPAVYQTFVDYYGSETFYDDFIQAALSGSATSFANGNADFSSMSDAARAEAAHKASAYGAVWMYVFRELWHAIYLCQTDVCAEDSCFNEAAVHEVDEAVAFYTGSLEGTDGSGTGVLTYGLAEKRCAQFGTCTSSSNAQANVDAFEVFNMLSTNIVDEDCDSAQTNTDRLIQIASIPLFQGILKYAYATGEMKEEGDAAEAEGATFAFLALPMIHACSADDAATIYENLKTGQKNTASFAAVKAALENNYECLGLTAADIGEYNEGESSDEAAESSGSTGSGSSSSNNNGPSAGSIATGAASSATRFVQASALGVAMAVAAFFL